MGCCIVAMSKIGDLEYTVTKSETAFSTPNELQMNAKGTNIFSG